MEARMVLSGSTLNSLVPGLANPAVDTSPTSPSLSVVAVTPSKSAVVTSSPSSLSVTFDRPIDDISVGNQDFELVHVASDGSTSPMLSGEAVLGESLDRDGTQIDLTLSKPLTQGRYQLILNAGNLLQGIDGTLLAGSGSGLVVDDFTFSQHDKGFSSAIDLQTLGPQVTALTGNLNLAKDPGAVQYYKFELAPGHHWLVGLEILAHANGGALDSSISVFSSKGMLISTANEGLPGDPGDPYLFQGLDPGTYYVGISAKKNLPNASGVYDPSSSGIGSTNPGGPFQLEFVADTADQPTQVLGIRLDHADPLSTNPTGLTLQFSGAIDLAALERSSQPAMKVVDVSGQTWPITLTSYDSTTGQLSLAFNQSLPSGAYTLELAGANSLTDLAGRAPITAGLPEGILGSFVVAPSSPVPGDLGPIFPGEAYSGISTTMDVVPGKLTTEQFVVIEPGGYVIKGLAPGSAVGLSVLDGSGKLLVTGPSDPTTGNTILTATPGVYQIVLTTNSLPSSVTLSINQKVGQFSSLLESGVAQLPALSLRLGRDFRIDRDHFPTTPVVNPTSSLSASTSASGSPGTALSGTGHSSTTDAVGSFQGSSSLAIGLSIPGGPSVAGQFSGSGLVGRSSSQSSQITVVGTSSASSLASIASNSASLARGLVVVPFESNGELEPEVIPVDPEVTAEPKGSPKAGITLESGLLARSAASRRADDKTLSDADWVSQLLGASLDWLEGTSPEVVAAIPPPAETGLQATDEPISAEEGRLESASMASPISLGVVLGLIVYGSSLRASRRKTPIARPAAETCGSRPLVVSSSQRS